MDTTSSDILHGLKAIAKDAGLNDRQAKHLAASHGLPIFKVGKTVCSRRSDVNAYFAPSPDNQQPTSCFRKRSFPD